MTQEKFATVLKIIIGTYVKDETIRQGFVTTGLCPWNPDAYIKCLGKTNTRVALNSRLQDMPFTKFESIIVNSDVINKFKNVEALTGALGEGF